MRGVLWWETIVDVLKIGIVGSGGIAIQHGQGWLTNAERAKVVAVADVSEDRARQFRDRYTAGEAKLYDDIEALLLDPEVDAVDICLPHHLHTSAIVASANAGKAILCEKPLCTSLDDAALIRDTLSRTGVTLMGAHNQLFQPAMIEARRLLDAGTLGQPYILRSFEVHQSQGFGKSRGDSDLAAGESPWAWRMDPARAGGGEILDTGWHGTYRLLALAADRPIEVSTMLGRFYIDTLQVEDTGLISVRFASGMIGEILTSWAFANVGGMHFEIGCEHGSIAGGATTLLHQLHGWKEAAERQLAPVHTFTAEITHFLNVIQRGATNPATVDDGARALQVITAAYRSAAEQRTITLPEDPTLPGEPATHRHQTPFSVPLPA